MAFLGNMAASMAEEGASTFSTVWRCRSIFSQSTNYSNVTNIRKTESGPFWSYRWTAFFYSSRLRFRDSGFGHYSDVFMSTETQQHDLRRLLFRGPLGIGDPVGSGCLKGNMLKAVRAGWRDCEAGWRAATPIDSVFVSDAQGVDVPMIAAAATDFGSGMKYTTSSPILAAPITR